MEPERENRTASFSAQIITETSKDNDLTLKIPAYLLMFAEGTEDFTLTLCGSIASRGKFILDLGDNKYKQESYPFFHKQ